MRLSILVEVADVLLFALEFFVERTPLVFVLAFRLALILDEPTGIAVARKIEGGLN
jgi:hypothetical protein